MYTYRQVKLHTLKKITKSATRFLNNHCKISVTNCFMLTVLLLRKGVVQNF